MISGNARQSLNYSFFILHYSLSIVLHYSLFILHYPLFFIYRSKVTLPAPANVDI